MQLINGGGKTTPRRGQLKVLCGVATIVPTFDPSTMSADDLFGESGRLIQKQLPSFKLDFGRRR